MNRHVLLFAVGGLFLLARAPSARGAASTLAERHVQSIAALDKRLVVIERQLQGFEEARAEAERAEARAVSKQAVSTLALARAERVLAHRLGGLSRRRPAADLVWRMGAKRLSAWLDEERLHRAVAEHDHRLMMEVRRARESLGRATQERSQALALVRSAQSERRSLRASLGRERRRRVDALQRLARLAGRGHAVVALHRAGAQEIGLLLERDQGNVNGRSLTHEGQWPTDQNLLAGEMTPAAQAALPWPVPGRLRSRFGDRVDLAFGTVTRQHGIDIAAPAGSRVRSVARGQVVYADWLQGYGQTVIVAHPHQVHSVHAHLSHLSVRVGQGVESQQSLGLAGDTGSMRGRVLYFEMRKRGRPEDPLRWLAPRP